MPKTDNVFLNCPFDVAYAPLFRAIIFAVTNCGLRPRCALEVEDSGQIRVLKIYKIIAECNFGIHDISRTSLDPKTKLPRFNMPFELGLFLGAKTFGDANQTRKVSLILDKKRFRYQKFISDIAGQDIQPHNADPEQAIKAIRNWTQTVVHKQRSLPSGRVIVERHRTFSNAIPKLCAKAEMDFKELTYTDYVWLVDTWLEANALLG